MRAISTIKRAYTRLYSDSGQLVAYVEWSNGSRTEAATDKPREARGTHMRALFERAKRDGLSVDHETW